MHSRLSSVLKKIGVAVVVAFALIGVVFSAVFVGMQFGVFNVRGSNVERNRFFVTATTTAKSIPARPCTDPQTHACPWTQAPEWTVIAAGFTKDAGVISRVSAETGVPARLIMAVAAPEQMRFFTSEREEFKRIFEPLKILGSMSQFSLGVSGIKEETALQVEQNAIDPQSIFYTGSSTSELIRYPDGVDHGSVLYARLTDPHDHYYSYLYTALFIRQIEMQWQHAGYAISTRPDVIATLFNIGFKNSHPNPAPEAGGAAITIGGYTYAYGDLGGQVYASSELLDVFAR